MTAGPRLGEEWPTGSFGHPKPRTAAHERQSRAWTPEEQAAHVADLEAALKTWTVGRHRAQNGTR